MSEVWARIRAKLARHGIKLYGFRVAEPNHDGCPHWHFLVFLPAWARRRVRRTFLHNGLKTDGGESGAQKHRVTFKAIDKAKGSATGYIAKYIAKNIDGFRLDADIYGGNPLEAAERVSAWAACWGIRQFQQLGGPPVTVWRELRRLDSEEDGILERARACADTGDWAGFVRAMGGPTAGRESWPIHPAYWQEIDTRTGEIPLNRYGELPTGKIFGLRVGEVYHTTRWHQWEIKPGADLPEPELPMHEEDPVRWEIIRRDTVGGPISRQSNRGPSPEDLTKLHRGRSGLNVPIPSGMAYAWEALSNGAAAAPWSSVNNCTDIQVPSSQLPLIPISRIHPKPCLDHDPI